MYVNKIHIQIYFTIYAYHDWAKIDDHIVVCMYVNTNVERYYGSLMDNQFEDYAVLVGNVFIQIASTT